MFDEMIIDVNGINLDIKIGCYSYERLGTQPVEIDLKLSLGSWSCRDELGNTVDYAALCDFVKNIVKDKAFYLIESLAKFIADKLLEEYILIKSVHVSIGKPNIYGEKANQIKVNYFQPRLYKVALALGSNLNNPRQQLISAIEFLSEFVTDINCAPIYKSSPYGFSEQNDFYNTCISGYTKLEPQQLLTTIKTIEKHMGKLEQFDNGPRVIDLDIILFDNIIYDKLFLQIPHIDMHNRDFVLKPLVDIEPDWIHPKYKETVNSLYKKLPISEQFILQVADK